MARIEIRASGLRIIAFPAAFSFGGEKYDKAESVKKQKGSNENSILLF